MAYYFSSNNGLPFAVNTVTVTNEDGSTAYTLSDVTSFRDFQLVVNYLRFNCADLSYKNGGQLVDLIRYRLGTGTDDITQDLAHGRKIIFA